MKLHKLTGRLLSPTIISLLLLITLIYCVQFFKKLNEDLNDKNIRKKVEEELVNKKSILEKSLYSRLYYTKSVAANISINPNITSSTYQNYAAKLITDDTLTATMAISKNCIITSVYPIKGHEAAIGLDLLSHPKRRDIVNQTIRTGKTFIQGPTALVEGGIGLISYTPVFTVDTNNNEAKFWGVADVVIYWEKLLKEAGFYKESEYSFALKGEDGSGENSRVIWGDSSIFANIPSKITISLPTGEWALAAVPKNGWKLATAVTAVIDSVLYLSVIALAFLVWLLLKAHSKLRTNEKKYRELVENTNNIILRTDIEGKITFFNEFAQNLFGYNESEIIGKTIEETIIPKQSQSYDKYLSRYYNYENFNNESYREIIESQLKNGTKVWISWRHKNIFEQNGKIKEILAVGFDVSEKVKAELALYRTEAQQRALISSMEDLIIEFDREGRYIYIAETSENLLYRPSKEILNKRLDEIFDREKAKFFMDSIIQCLDDKKTIRIEYPLIIDDKEFWFEANISQISFDSVIFVARNISERKKAEEERNIFLKELKKLNATKDKFFSIIAHDLKNPLGNFQNIAEVLSSDYENLKDIERKEFINILCDSSKKIYELLENLLEWSRSQRGIIKFNPEQISIKQILDNVLSLAQLSYEAKSITIINNISNEVRAFADINMAMTILRNLISNAIKFTPNKGKIKILAESIEENGSSFLKISVVDNGLGISAENIDKLFRIDVNLTTLGSNDEKGTGLGLILCKEFVEKHKGRIWAESELSVGTSFSFTLPIKS